MALRCFKSCAIQATQGAQAMYKPMRLEPNLRAHVMPPLVTDLDSSQASDLSEAEAVHRKQPGRMILSLVSPSPPSDRASTSARSHLLSRTTSYILWFVIFEAEQGISRAALHNCCGHMDWWLQLRRIPSPQHEPHIWKAVMVLRLHRTCIRRSVCRG